MMANAGGGFTVTAMGWLLEELPTASVTLKVTEPLPPPVGRPVIAPVLVVKLNPGGSVPLVTLHVNGLVPPDSTSVWL